MGAAEIVIRPAEMRDLKVCYSLNGSYVTEYVWQMEAHAGEEEIALAFRLVELPRPMCVRYPRDGEHLHLEENWRRDECFLVAEDGENIQGYIDMTVQAWNGTGWVNNLIVAKNRRREGIGTALLLAAMHWARERGLRQILVETQTKNYPAICFLQKNGFVFCGFSDRHYLNKDIAVFFAKSLR